MNNPQCINVSNYRTRFSICTLVTNLNEYEEMVQSFKNAGFTNEFTEFLYIDNIGNNNYDAFGGLNKFLNTASGKYIILCHEDILLKYDNLDILEHCIKEIDALDQKWAVLGNAGFSNFADKCYRISDPWGENIHIGHLPAKVKSLDENFLIVKHEANLALSSNLNGFHMYGTDLCSMASFLGWNSYVINFHLYHKSPGNCNQSFFKARQQFIHKYQTICKPLSIRTTCTSMIITSSPLLNWILNRKFVYSIKKRLDTLTKIYKSQTL